MLVSKAIKMISHQVGSWGCFAGANRAECERKLEEGVVESPGMKKIKKSRNENR